MSSKQTVLVVDVPTVLSCLCLVGDPLLVLEIAGRGHKSLNWFRLEGDLGGGGNGQHVDHALGPCNNVGTVVLLARDVAALLPVGNLFCTYSLKFYILEQKSRTFVKTVSFLSVIRLI